MTREMKDSGKSWIGTIPSHWELMRIKNVVKQSKDGIKIGPFGSALTNKTIGNGKFNVYSQANLIASDFLSTKNTVDGNTFEELKSYEVFPGDICLSMMGTIGKCKKVPLGIKRGIMDSHLIKIRLSDFIDSRFFEYVYDKDYSGVCFAQMQYDKKGFIMDGLNTAVVKNLFIPLPPLLEQIHISDYLDSECSRIDSVIEQTRASIEEYKKLKQAVITQAVTKGIRPNREMKDSGIDVIKYLPSDWYVYAIKHLCSQPITDGTHLTPDYSDAENGSPFLSSKDISTGYIDWKNIKYITKELHVELQKRIAPQFEDILLAKNGTTGIAAIVESNKTFDVYVTIAVIRVDKQRVLPKFLLYSINSLLCKHQFDEHLKGIGVPNLHLGTINNTKVFLPSIEEQKLIVLYLDEKISKLDLLIKKKTLLLDTLESYKKSLIFEYVTGKKEVI